MKRFVAILVALLSMVWTAGCSTLPKNFGESSESSGTVDSAGSSSNITTAGPFTLGYSSGDSLNPFTAATRNNLELCSLLFEGLTALDNTLTAKPDLAASIDSSVPSILTATLRSDARFSDGSSVMPADVTESFTLAKNSSSFKVLLSNVKSARADGNKIIFELNSPDPNASACLSFPVMKAGTGSAPIGSGLYVLKPGDSPVLNANPRNPAKPRIGVIHLLDITDDSAMLYSLESGAISYFYTDLANGDIPRTSNASVNVPLNSLVFIGINAGRSSLSNAAVRKALNDAISRTEICANAFAGRALPSISPFHSKWAAASTLKGFEIGENISAAVAQLGQAGYNNTSKNILTLEMLVSKGNSFREAAAELLRQQLAKASITLKVTVLPFADYTQRIKSTDFDLYLGEIRLSANMSLQPLLASGGSAAYGVKTSGDAASAYTKYLSGELTLQQFTDVFSADMPYIPLCWREGMAAHNRALTGVTPTGFDVFYGFEGWSYP